MSTKGVFTQWHELLGWHTPTTDPAQNQNVALMKKQFHMLWSHRSIKLLLGNKLNDVNRNYIRMEFQTPNQPSSSNLLRRALERNAIRNPSFSKTGKITWRKLDSSETIQISRVCALYYAGLNTLSQLKMDILTGICYNDNVLYDLWLFITSLGAYCGLKEFLDLLRCDGALNKPQTAMLMLFCDCMTHHVT